jgi:hypothetical protein
LESAFDSLPGFGRHGLLWVLILIAALRGSSQKLELLTVARTPATHRKMNPQADALNSRERSVERFRLQADSLFAARRKRAKSFN